MNYKKNHLDAVEDAVYSVGEKGNLIAGPPCYQCQPCRQPPRPPIPQPPSCVAPKPACSCRISKSCGIDKKIESFVA